MNQAVDLTESSLLELIDQLRASFDPPYSIRPTQYVLPPWVVEEIEAQYGAPATQAKFHQWNMRRTGMSERDYWAVVAPELAPMTESE